MFRCLIYEFRKTFGSSTTASFTIAANTITFTATTVRCSHGAIFALASNLCRIATNCTCIVHCKNQHQCDHHNRNQHPVDHFWAKLIFIEFRFRNISEAFAIDFDSLGARFNSLWRRTEETIKLASYLYQGKTSLSPFQNAIQQNAANWENHSVFPFDVSHFPFSELSSNWSRVLLLMPACFASFEHFVGASQ